MTALTDRYVYAATRLIASETERRELELELRERIGDTVAALTDAGATPADAEQQALTDLGDPLRLSAEYRQKPMHLIGPRFYYTWLRLLVMITCIAAPIVGVIAALAAVSDGDDVGEVIVAGGGSMISVAIQCVFWVTLFFAIAERTPINVGQPAWTTDLLPQLPNGGGSSRRNDMIGSFVMLAIFAVLLVWQQIGSPFHVDGDRIPVLDPALWVPWLWFVIVVLAAEAVHAYWVYRSGWTWSTAAVNTVTAVVFAAIVVPLLLQDRLLNPELVELLGWTGKTATPCTIAAIAVVAVGVWDIASGFFNAARRLHGKD